MNNIKKKLGIVGGMGPWATAHFFELIVKLTNAETDKESMRVFIDNNTSIPDRTRAILNSGISPVEEIINSINLLEKSGAEIIAIPCNTSHYYYDKISHMTNLTILNIIKVTIKASCRAYGNKCCGILATAGTIGTGLYQNPLKEKGCSYLLPTEDEQKIIMLYIYGVVKANKKDTKIIKQMEMVMKSMMRRGAQYFILGCTELSIMKESYPFNKYSVIDSTIELAKEAILSCGYKIREEK